VPPVELPTGWIEPEIDSISGERRSRPRYTMQLPLHYKLLDEGGWEGSGITRNLSSGGVAFELAETLPPGAHVELTIQWPVTLNGHVPLNLLVEGYVAWNGHGLAAVRTVRCQFRTRGKTMASGGSALP
jgi:hypothetical protein